MLSDVFRLAAQKFQVVNGVVKLVPVLVVNNFISLQNAANVLLHNEPMLQYSSAVNANEAISVVLDGAGAIRFSLHGDIGVRKGKQ